MRKGRYGFTCYGCRESLDTPYSNPYRAEKFASDRGWKIGHYDGQGHIVCPDCETVVWDARPLCVSTPREVERSARRYARQAV